MRSSYRIGLVVSLLAAGGMAAWLFLPLLLFRFEVHKVDIETGLEIGKAPVSSEPALCPWREPEHDIKEFFPAAGSTGSTSYRTELFTLSRHRVEILRRLGPGARIESHSLYVHQVLLSSGSGTQVLGAVMVRRFSAPHGAMEVVVAVDNEGRVLGVRIQRQREPPEIAAALNSPAFLRAFKAKTAESQFHVGQDLPNVPAPAREAAESMAAAIRARLIEYTVGAKTPGHEHH